MNLVIRVSYDEGRTFPVERQVWAGHAAYSDLTILKDKTVGVLWERGAERGYQFITCTRLGREFLEAEAMRFHAKAQRRQGDKPRFDYFIISSSSGRIASYQIS